MKCVASSKILKPRSILLIINIWVCFQTLEIEAHKGPFTQSILTVWPAGIIQLLFESSYKNIPLYTPDLDENMNMK